MNTKILQKIAFTTAMLFLWNFAICQCSATLSGGGEICQGQTIDLMVAFTGDGPWTFSYSHDGTAQPPVSTAFNPFILPVNQFGVYQLISVSTPTCSNGTVSGFAFVGPQTPLSALNIEEECDALGGNLFYTVSFEIVGGDPATYQVLPPNSGTLNGNIFTSNPITSGTSYFFEIIDGNGCGVTPVNGLHNCNCTSQAGTMNQALIEVNLCDNVPAVGTYDNSTEVLDPDDTLVFILHTSPGPDLGTIWAFNSTPSFFFDPATMFSGATYYISALVGNASVFDPFIDTFDPCLSVSVGQPVIFHGIQINLSTALGCNGDPHTITVNVTGGTPPYEYFWSNGASGPSIQVFASGSYFVTVSDVTGCTATAQAFINQVPTICSPVVSGELTCAQGTVDIVTNCAPSNGFLSFLWSNGNTTPNLTVNTPGTYTVTITDINGCTTVYDFEILENTAECGSIQGTVAEDANLDCIVGSGENPLQNWVVKASGDNDFYALTDANGNYTMDVLVGDYALEIIPPVPDFWEACQSPVSVTIEDENDIDTVDFPLEKLVDCPLLEVDLGTWAFRRCFTTTTNVNYCNHGTAIAEDVYIEITLDPLLELTAASVPYSGPANGVYTFQVGDVGIGECGSFSLDIFTDCNAVLGQTLCSEAHIFPDSHCVPNGNWSEASIELTSECGGDSIYFTITNVGTGGMTEALQYIVIEDGVMMMEESGGPILGAGESFTIAVPANGSTYIIQVEQAENHPGFSSPLLAVEGCGTNNAGSFSIGFASQFPEDDADPFISIDCHAVIGSFDPNDKRGFPLGYGDDHLIEKGQALDYHIRFQNTGTDTAFNVRIVDVLSEKLDPSTFRPAAASHPYEVEFRGNDTLIFLFPNILLPDSNVNEALSHGFVKFRIGQAAGNQLGDIIENTADIFFDFNDAVTTNTSVHQLGENFITTATFEPFHLNVQVAVQPNPASQETTIQLLGDWPKGEISIQLFDLSGKAVHRAVLPSSASLLDLGNLANGLYFFEIKADGTSLGNGKLVVEH